jgi:O-antigen ligase
VKLAYAACILFFGMEIFGYRGLGWLSGSASSGGVDAGSGTPIGQVFYLLALGTAIVANRPMQHARRLLVIPLPLLLALIWCWISVTWAIAPSIALRRVMLVTVVAWTVLLIVQVLGYQRSLHALRVILALALLVCFIVIFAVPSIGVQLPAATDLLNTTPGWRGIMVDKNAYGAFAAMTAIIFLFDGGSFPKIWRWIIFGAALICLVGSQSKTSLGIFLMVVPMASILGRFEPKYRTLLLPLLIILGIIVYLSWGVLVNPFRLALYDPKAFTGRGEIWRPIMNFIQDHPIRGSGFGSFWSIGYESPINQYTRYEWVQKISQGHNGYIDLWASIGLPGLLLAIFGVIFYPLIFTLANLQIKRQSAVLIIAMILFCAGNNLTETTLLSRDTFLNVMLMVSIGLARAAARSPRRSAMNRVHRRRRGLPEQGARVFTPPGGGKLAMPAPDQGR